jgi:hypothetical protein
VVEVPPELTAELLADSRLPRHPAISPDGRWVAYVTAGMAVCPAELVQVTGRPPLALFADGLDTALYQLDPGTQRFRRVVGWAGLVEMLTASSPGDVIAAA